MKALFDEDLGALRPGQHKLSLQPCGQRHSPNVGVGDGSSWGWTEPLWTGKVILPFQVATFPMEGPIFSDQRQGMISSSLAFLGSVIRFYCPVFAQNTRDFVVWSWTVDSWTTLPVTCYDPLRLGLISQPHKFCVLVTGMKGNLQTLVDLLCSFELTIIHISSSWDCIIFDIICSFCMFCGMESLATIKQTESHLAWQVWWYKSSRAVNRPQDVFWCANTDAGVCWKQLDLRLSLLGIKVFWIAWS